MKRVFFLVLAVTVSLLQSAQAQESRLRIYCESCRDIVEHPEDVRNFGLNQLYGADSWLTFDQADRFDVLDSLGNLVTVDINIDYVVLDLTFLRDDVPYALTFILQIRLVYATGDIVTYKFDLTDLNPTGSLPVPASGSRPPAYSAVTGDHDELDEDDEDYRSEDFEEPGAFETEDGSCDACEVYFDADQDGVLDDDPVDWIEEL